MQECTKNPLDPSPQGLCILSCLLSGASCCPQVRAAPVKQAEILCRSLPTHRSALARDRERRSDRELIIDTVLLSSVPFYPVVANGLVNIPHGKPLPPPCPAPFQIQCPAFWCHLQAVVLTRLALHSHRLKEAGWGVQHPHPCPQLRIPHWKCHLPSQCVRCHCPEHCAEPEEPVALSVFFWPGILMSLCLPSLSPP